MATPPPRGDGRRCSRCRTNEAASSHYWCRPCQNAHHRLWTLAQVGASPEFLAYRRAWDTTRRACYRLGYRPACRDCGNKGSPFVLRPRKPYAVLWLCKACRRRQYPDRHYTGAPLRARAGACA